MSKGCFKTSNEQLLYTTIHNTMASDVCWNNLPSVVLLEIFKRISHEERLNASSTCKEWRKALFFPNFWRELSINIYSKNDKYAVERCQFFTRSFILSLRNIKIIFSYKNVYFSQVVNVLSKLSGNRQVQKLYLFCFEEPTWHPNLSSCVKNLKTLVGIVKNLNTFYISHCWPALLDKNSLKSALEKQKDSLTILGLGAVYCDNLEPHPELPINLTVYQHLSILCLDHSWITDEIINQISDKNSLTKLVIQLNKVYKGHEVRNETWDHFRQSLPNCELKVNLVLGADEAIFQVCTYAMPITHIKILYCDNIDFESLPKFDEFRDLKSLWYIGNNKICYTNTFANVMNPLVAMGYYCHKVEEMVISGIHIDEYDWVGVARLRGPKLRRLDIDESDIVKSKDGNTAAEPLYTTLTKPELNKFKKDMSEALERSWSPTHSNMFKNSSSTSHDDKILNIVDILSQDFEH